MQIEYRVGDPTYNFKVRRVEKLSGLQSLITQRDKKDEYLQTNIIRKYDMDKTSLGDRMKEYEAVPHIKLTKRMPLLIRVDGKAFHTFTKKFDKPFDLELSDVMKEVAEYLVKSIQGAKLAYTQSDEISILITDYDQINTSSWYDKKLQKIVSVSAAMATMKFMECLRDKKINADKLINDYVLFDSRAWVMPMNEVTNYFIWRQKDATRNSVQMLGRAHFSHKQLQGLKNPQIQDKLMLEKQVNWNDIPTRFKRGLCVVREGRDIVTDLEIPIFTADREYIDSSVYLPTPE